MTTFFPAVSTTFTFAFCMLLMVMFVFIPDLLLKYEKSAIAVLPQVGQCLEIVQDPKGLAAIIWIIGEHGQVRAM